MKNWVFLSLVGSLLVPGAALAQEEAAAPSTTEPVNFHAEHAGLHEGHATEEPIATSEAAEEAAEETEEEDRPWYSDFTLNAFVDTFYMVDWNTPERADATSDVIHRAYDYTNGFGLAFAGLDVSYMREKFGATIGLRYGRGAERYLIGTNSFGYLPLKQAFVSIMPTDGLAIDVGQFDTPFGAEVAESWLNLTYSRSALNYLMQPFYHTGVRATYQVNDQLMLRGLVVNGINNGIDSNLSPYVGAQVGYTPSDSFSLYVGYLTGAPVNLVNQTDPTVSRPNKPFEHFFDLVANVSVGDLKFILNGDLWFNPNDSAASLLAMGVSGTVGYQLSERFAVAGRIDYLHMPINDDGSQWYGTGVITGVATPWEHLVTGTATLDFRPWGNHAILRLEQRLEWANENTFPKGTYGIGDPTMNNWNTQLSDIWTSTTLSVVVQTGG